MYREENTTFLNYNNSADSAKEITAIYNENHTKPINIKRIVTDC